MGGSTRAAAHVQRRRPSREQSCAACVPSGSSLCTAHVLPNHLNCLYCLVMYPQMEYNENEAGWAEEKHELERKLAEMEAGCVGRLACACTAPSAGGFGG